MVLPLVTVVPDPPATLIVMVKPLLFTTMKTLPSLRGAMILAAWLAFVTVKTVARRSVPERVQSAYAAA